MPTLATAIAALAMAPTAPPPIVPHEFFRGQISAPGGVDPTPATSPVCEPVPGGVAAEPPANKPGFPYGSRPEKYLRLAMGRVFRRCVVAVVETRDPLGESRRTIRARMTLDGKGKLLTEIRPPGPPIVMLDDGERVAVRLPDRKVVMESESPIVSEGPIDARLALVRQNYILALSEGERKFGRRTVVLTARPRNGGMAMRRYILDAETGYPLSHEAIREGESSTIFRAIEATFSGHLSDDAMAPPSYEGYERVRAPEPIAYSSDAARQRAGFVALIPKKLPLGFDVRKVTINDSPEWRAITFRVSDGLVRATVYEWLTNPRDGRMSSRGGREVRQKGGLTFMVVCDEGPLVRTKLLDAFAGD